MTTLAEAEVLVHTGLPKTATTWLQEHLFSHPELGFWPPAQQEVTRKQQVKSFGRLFYMDAGERLIADEDFDMAALKAKFGAISVPEGLVPVISNERLAGHPLSNAFDCAIIARRIAQALPRARILAVIREQRSMILSSYIQYLKYGGWRSLDGFMFPPSDARLPVLQFEVWNYDRLAKTYYDQFGADRVLILPYEMFAVDPAAYVKRICNFAEVAEPSGLPFGKMENPRRSHIASYYLRWLTCINRSTSANAFFPRPFGALLGKAIDRSIKIAVGAAIPTAWDRNFRQKLENRIEAAVGNRYDASNGRLAEMIGIDLSRFGYRL
jgi:sulfotransferase family protein